MNGLHPAISADAYHADPAPAPSLSSSIAKTILHQTPRHAWFEHPRLNPNFEPKDDSKFDLGSVAHELLLGKGAGFVSAYCEKQSAGLPTCGTLCACLYAL
jgi:hypothetical protein